MYHCKDILLVSVAMKLCVSLNIDVDITKYGKEQTTKQLNEFITEVLEYFDKRSSVFQ